MSIRPRLLLLVNESGYFLSHRTNIARAAAESGFDVHVATRLMHDVREIERHGVTVHHVDFPRGLRSPLIELRAVRRLTDIYRTVAPDVVHHFSAKAVLLGSLAASRLKLESVVNTFTGLGSAFSADGLRARCIRQCARRVLRRLLRPYGWRVTFQNRADMQQLIMTGVVRESQCHLIRGSGVDPTVFCPAGEPLGPPTIILASRMIWTKGIGEFVEAARTLHYRGTEAQFVLLGQEDAQNPATIPTAQLKAWNQEGIVQWRGHCENMPEMLGRSTIVVLPTYYGEGLPKILLEAAACGKPIVATRTRGCDEIVRDGENGYLVPPRDPRSLAQAIARLLSDPHQRWRMGSAGRRIVLSEFTADHVADQTIEIYQQMLGPSFWVQRSRRFAA